MEEKSQEYLHNNGFH